MNKTCEVHQYTLIDITDVSGHVFNINDTIIGYRPKGYFQVVLICVECGTRLTGYLKEHAK